MRKTPIELSIMLNPRTPWKTITENYNACTNNNKEKDRNKL